MITRFKSMSDLNQKPTDVDRQTEMDLHRANDSVKIKHEKPDESTLAVDCGALVKQESLEGDCTATCYNVYDSKFDVLQHKLCNQNLGEGLEPEKFRHGIQQPVAINELLLARTRGRRGRPRGSRACGRGARAAPVADVGNVGRSPGRGRGKRPRPVDERASGHVPSLARPPPSPPVEEYSEDPEMDAEPFPPSPGMSEVCHNVDKAVPSSRVRRRNGDDCFKNIGSESESEDSDGEELAAPLVPRTVRVLMEAPQEDVSHPDPPSSGPGAADGPIAAMAPNFLDFHWTPFPNPPIPPELRKEKFSSSDVGPTAPHAHPYETFTAIWDPRIMEHIASETNRYAQELAQQLMSNNALTPQNRISEWRDTNVDELYVYLAIVLAMGNVVKHRVEAYWSPSADIFRTPGFRAHMPLRRFQLLSRCLHFNKNEDISKLKLGSSEAKLFKIEPVVSHLNDRFQQMYNLQQNIAVDESLLLWKGWLNINQFISNKAASVGIKTYELCESQTGYLWRFVIHAHGTQTESTRDDPLDAFVPATVLKLVRGLENRGHTVWMDSFYNSPALARKLKTLGFDCAGTLRTNRQFVPECLRKMTKEDMRPGQIAGLTSGDVDLMVWRDHNRVAMISTYHGNAVSQTNDSHKPILIFDHNFMMGGVDKKDRMLATYPVERRRTKVWYKRFFRRLLNVSVLNAYIICKKNSSRLNHFSFRETLIRSILEKHSAQVVVRPKTPDLHSIEHHHLAELAFTRDQSARKRRKCRVCKRRVQTYCVGCSKTVCMTPCFVHLHYS